MGDGRGRSGFWAIVFGRSGFGRSGFGAIGFWGDRGLGRSGFGAIGCFLGMAGPRALLRLTHPTSEVLCVGGFLYVGGFVRRRFCASEVLYWRW